MEYADREFAYTGENKQKESDRMGKSETHSRKHKGKLIRWGITREELAGIARSDQPVPLAGLLNVWCISGSTNRGLALINVVATDQSAG
jgi:hypothetical protein